MLSTVERPGSAQRQWISAPPPDERSATCFADAAYRQYFGTTYASAMRAMRNPEAAADVTQEAFMHLLTEARRGRRPDNAAAWLSRTATNGAISRIRRASVAQRLAPRLLDRSSPAQPEAIVVERELGSDMLVALASLRATERRALILAAQGRTGMEIARDLGRSNGATRALMCRARATLRTTMLRTAMRG
jgi:RNA polymerase sigma factor (sigma-70 family)